MYYLIGRDLDCDGKYEFVKDMDNMILTEDSRRALQVSKAQLAYIDMDYLNEAGFYAMEAKRFNVSILEELLFTTLVRGFRPRVAPPPRRRPRRMPPPPLPRPRRAPRPRSRSFAMDVIDALTPMHARPTRHGPKPKPVPARGPRALAGPGKAPARPARPGAGRKGPGGRGPGR